MEKILLLLLFLFLFIPNAKPQDLPPKYEFRGVWVATVENIDWPSRPGLTTKAQKKEVVDILDKHRKNGINAIILQVRPAADAFYPSELEPWSVYLTGKQGRAPKPYYDPLEFWITECHKRGMEFHAWLNPFRVAQNSADLLSPNHIAFKHPEWVLKYGNRLYFDPGLPETRNFVTSVVTDLVKRYDVDAINFDDYFYPYPLPQDFPDTASFKKYSRAFPEKYKSDWRRENVDILIRQLSTAIKKTKPWVKFGISPFGVWRNKTDDPEGSDTRAGTTNYDHLFANVIKWQKKGWIDYLLPQLYWQIGHPTVDFAGLCDWWNNHSFDRGLYIGHAVYKIDPKSETLAWRNPSELPNQIKKVRSTRGINGSAFYSSKHFKRDLLGFQDSLQTVFYKVPAIVPPMPWIDSLPPPAPLNFRISGKKIKWDVTENPEEMDKPKKFAIYVNEAGKEFNQQKIYKIVTGTSYKLSKLNLKRRKYEIRISAFDRLNNESAATVPLIIKI